LHQTRGAFFRSNNLGPFYHNTNGERSYSALGAIHHYFYITEPVYPELFKDGNRRPLSYIIETVKSVLGKELCQYIETLNDSESPAYSFGEIAEKIMNGFH
jgi:hypothetical protein